MRGGFLLLPSMRIFLTHMAFIATSSGFAPGFLRSTTPLWRSTSLCARRVSSLSMLSAEKSVLVPIGHGSEEIETTCIVDTLVRAGAKVTVASVEPGELCCVMSRGIKITADASLADSDDLENKQWDAIVCPGGMPGAERLRDDPRLTRMLTKQATSGSFVAAVCAAPAVVLETHGILNGCKATCYPAPPFVSKLEEEPGRYVDSEAEKVVVDGNVVTSRGPGTSLLFALKLVELLYSSEKAEELAAQMLVVRE